MPEFVVLTAQAYEDRDRPLEKHLADAITQLETLTMQGLGAAKALWCSPSAVPPVTTFLGCMDTYLNVGVTEKSLPCLEKMYGRVPARKMFLNNLRNLCRFLGRDKYAAIVSAVRTDLPPMKSMRFVEQLTADHREN